jgi:hypothetical protein
MAFPLVVLDPSGALSLLLSDEESNAAFLAAAVRDGYGV